MKPEQNEHLLLWIVENLLQLNRQLTLTREALQHLPDSAKSPALLERLKLLEDTPQSSALLRALSEGATAIRRESENSKSL
jgi:hypothetical protein